MLETLERLDEAPAVRRAVSRLNPSPASAGALVARLTVGLIMLLHGLQKVGYLGGHGWSGTLAFFQTQLGIPRPLGAVAILVELVGGALLLLGLFSRPVAFLIAGEMVVAAVMVHVPNGFFINWEMVPGKGHGFEMNLALIGLALVVVLAGAGRYALDTWLGARRRHVTG